MRQAVITIDSIFTETWKTSCDRGSALVSRGRLFVTLKTSSILKFRTSVGVFFFFFFYRCVTFREKIFLILARRRDVYYRVRRHRSVANRRPCSCVLRTHEPFVTSIL